MTINPKVLTISASEYCLMEEKELSDFVAEGVDTFCPNINALMKVRARLAAAAPARTEVIVDYRIATRGGYGEFAYGTVLILKGDKDGN